eukprot:TRINITY_DN67704_c0_g1_i1.p1 TRINITY_DN67704_c0_g1~~TRINITY_DN67704_c0_g1_i1.p1  ORF type:complete len:1016 (+),score=179.34 TRINITY_DN67704_c0_g1_i1:75-3050(+)
MAACVRVDNRDNIPVAADGGCIGGCNGIRQKLAAALHRVAELVDGGEQGARDTCGTLHGRRNVACGSKDGSKRGGSVIREDRGGGGGSSLSCDVVHHGNNNTVDGNADGLSGHATGGDRNGGSWGRGGGGDGSGDPPNSVGGCGGGESSGQNADAEDAATGAPRTRNDCRPLMRITSSCDGSMPRLARRDKSNGDDRWHGFCSVCKRPLEIELLNEVSDNSETVLEASYAVSPTAKRSRHEIADCKTHGDEEDKQQRCAFVIPLWGASAEYVLGAIVLGWSLRCTGTKHSLVALHTTDVPLPALELLRRSGWQTREIEHVPASETLFAHGCLMMRFKHVFTKLQIFGLVEFDKVLLLDIDLFVCQNIDDLFDLPAPAAMARGPCTGYKHGDRMDGRYFFAGSSSDWSWGQASGINAGVMLLKPSLETLKQQLEEVADLNHPEHIRGNGPEQDYLSRYFAGEWSHIDVTYNFQLHQMYFALSPESALDGSDRSKLLSKPELLKVIHYSGEPKPWIRHLEHAYAAYSDDDWIREVQQSFKGYHAWVLKEPWAMQAELDRFRNIAMGPDGQLRRIDWAKVKSTGSSGSEACVWEASRKYWWKSQDDDSWWHKDWKDQQNEERNETNCDEGASGDGVTVTGDGGTGDTKPLSQCRYDMEDAAKSTDGKTEKISGDRCAAGSEEDGGSEVLFSENGYPLGDVVETPVEVIRAAEEIVRRAQALWDDAYVAIAKELGCSDLAQDVRAACRPCPSDVKDSVPEGEMDADVAETSGGDGWVKTTTGWWRERPVREAETRVVVCCTVMPRPHVVLSSNGQTLLEAHCVGVHVAAVVAGSMIAADGPSRQSAGCDGDGLVQPPPQEASLVPAPRSFALDGRQAAEAMAWATAVPACATVMLGVIIGPTVEVLDGAREIGGSRAEVSPTQRMEDDLVAANEVLAAFVEAGLGCPRAIDPMCAVAAAAGKKGNQKWYCTHAAPEAAIATIFVPPFTPTSGNET